MSSHQNTVLTEDARSSTNFYESDRILRHYLQKHVSGSGLEYMSDKLQRLGAQAAGRMNLLSAAADREQPRLKRRTPTGEPQNSVVFHPAYDELLTIAAESEMFYVQYEPRFRDRFAAERHQLGFAAGQLYAMTEMGVYCPLCMTDGAAHLVDQYSPEKLKERLLPRLTARSGEDLYTGAMFLTEKAGGSDVGRNLTTAEHLEDDRYLLNGEKWFCSNVNAEVIMALARTGKVEDGTRGLSLFLVEKALPDGSANPMDIIRLKDKLGVRSMATGEVRFTDTVGVRLGEENRGFRLMTEMINISRTYNAVAALAAGRRAVIEAWQYLNHRVTFGKRAVSHALVRRKFEELGANYVADFLLVWRAIRAMDHTGQGNSESERQLMRMLIPMAKWRSAEQAVYTVRECMELMGGNGYIEDFIMPRLLRDVNVLPIWEGSGNIILLDMLRAAQKTNALAILVHEIEETAAGSEKYGALISGRLAAVQELWVSLEQDKDGNGKGNRDMTEAATRPLFSELVTLYQMALLIQETGPGSAAWTEPALRYLASTYEEPLQPDPPIDAETLQNLIGWDY